MNKNKGKTIHWEPDVRKGIKDVRNIKEINQKLKEVTDDHKIKGY